MAKKIGKSFCVFSAKGGVGKTTTLLNLAGTYHLLGKKVLIIDFDLTSGGIALSLNKDVHKSIADLTLDIDNNHYTSLKDYVTQYNENIDFLASPIDPREAGQINARYLDLIMDRAILEYDIILIDTNHLINELNLVILSRVDNILFVMTNDPLDLKNLKTIISIFKDLNITNYKVLLNQGRDPFKNYYSLYDIKNILKTNIDYTISPRFHLKNIEDYIINGLIVTLDNRMAKAFPDDYTTFVRIATDFITDEEDQNEE